MIWKGGNYDEMLEKMPLSDTGLIRLAIWWARRLKPWWLLRRLK